MQRVGKNRATAGADTYSDLLIEELYKQNEMGLKTCSDIVAIFLAGNQKGSQN